MPDDLLIARNPEPDSTLPFLVRIPLGPRGIVVKAKQTWPREKKIYCHRAEGWPADAEIVERFEVRSCIRRGPAIDLVLARARENRSQFVIAQARGREMIFWQSPRTAKQARPAVRIPTARAHGQVLEIVVDTAEKYPYTFNGQQATTSRRRLPAGDYGVLIGEQVVAAVERKTIEDLSSSLLSGKLTYALAELTALPRAAVVVEDRYSRLFKLEHAPGARVAEALAEAQARFPDGADRVLRNPATGAGMDLPLVGRLPGRTDRCTRPPGPGEHVRRRGAGDVAAGPRSPSPSRSSNPLRSAPGQLTWGTRSATGAGFRPTW